MSRVGRYERGLYVLCVRLGAGSAHGVRALHDADGELHACRISEASAPIVIINLDLFVCNVFDRRRSTSVDGARG